MTATIGRYAIQSRLGAGGAAEVWEALLEGPAGFRKRVALKLVPERTSDSGALRHEARLGALLRHPNLVDVYELGEADDGRAFLAMELVAGPSLGALLRASGPLAGPALRDVGIQLAKGLAYIHTTQIEGGKGLVHRDIKPTNLLVDPAGTVKIADLGIARLTGSAIGTIEGTPGYLAPEQLEGREPAPTADVFSAGMVLWTMAVGSAPVRPGKALAAALRAAVTTRARAAEAAERLDAALPGLAAVVLRCVDPDPAARFADGAELGRALRAIPEPPGEGLLDVLARVGPVAEPPNDRRPTTDRTPSTGRLRAEDGEFMGRNHERDAVESRIEVRGCTVMLKGIAGVGKSRLALHVAHRWMRRGADVVWVDAAASTDRDSLLSAAAAALGVGAGADPAASVAAALGARVEPLLVLDAIDGARSAAAALLSEWLGAAPSLRVVATGRRALGAPDEVVVELGPLGADAGVALLRHHLGGAAAPIPLDAFARSLDHHPLAIVLAAARVRTGAAVDPSRASDDPLGDAVAGAWTDLAPWSRRALVQLSACRGTFAVEAAEAIVDLSDVPGAPWPIDVIDDLWRRSLLYVRSGKAGPRLGVYDAVQRHALRDAATDPDLLDGAHARHAAWFARFGESNHLDGLRATGGEERLRAMARDLDDLLVAHERASARGDADVAFATALAAATVLRYRGPWSRLTELLRDTLRRFPNHPRRDEALLLLAEVVDVSIDELDDAVRAAPTPRRRARAEAARVRLLSRRGESQRARDEGLHALERARASGDLAAAAECLLVVGIASRNLGLPTPAEAALGEALRVFERYGDRPRASSASQSLGNLMYNQGRVAEALALYRRAEEGFRASGDRAAVATSIANQSMALCTSGDVRGGERRAREALQLYAQIGDVHGEAFALVKLATALQHQRRFADAEAAIRRAVDIHRSADEPRFLAFALCTLGNSLMLQDRLDDARAPYDEAARIGERIASPRLMALALGNLAIIDIDRGRFAAARPTLDEALRLAAGVDPRFEAVFLGERARLELGLGLDPTATLALAKDRIDDVGTAPDIARFACIEALILAARGQLDAASARLRGVPLDDPDLARLLLNLEAAGVRRPRSV